MICKTASNFRSAGIRDRLEKSAELTDYCRVIFYRLWCCNKWTAQSGLLSFYDDRVILIGSWERQMVINSREPTMLCLFGMRKSPSLNKLLATWCLIDVVALQQTIRFTRITFFCQYVFRPLYTYSTQVFSSAFGNSLTRWNIKTCRDDKKIGAFHDSRNWM